MIHQFEWFDVFQILRALNWTVGLSVIAVAGGGILGLVIAILRVSESHTLRLIARGYVVLVQGTPLLVQLLLAFFGAGMLGYSVSPWLAASIALCINSAALFGETWSGSIRAVPPGQGAAGKALGLTRVHIFFRIVAPQAARIALAPTVGITVQIIKNTSITSVIGLVEITRAGQLLTSITFQPLLIYSIVAIIYFTCCWPLSLLNAHLERRTARQFQKAH